MDYKKHEKAIRCSICLQENRTRGNYFMTNLTVQMCEFFSPYCKRRIKRDQRVETLKYGCCSSLGRGKTSERQKRWRQRRRKTMQRRSRPDICLKTHVDTQHSRRRQQQRHTQCQRSRRIRSKRRIRSFRSVATARSVLHRKRGTDETVTTQ